ncbi:MAG: glypican [Synechococcaceae cyanobacterium]
MLALACTAIGALVVAGVVVVTLAPVVLGLAALVLWLAISLVLAWLGIEAMAALERWLENDPRFQR